MKKSDMLIMGFRTLNRVLKSEDHSMMAKYLQRIKELEEEINLLVTSEEGKGTKFTIKLPISNK
ncbi:MAG: hypothetical protein A2Y23_04020 [Clostridiales bacterium GWB2_37_7]|nr:MAG: hypothetical protein A2Y23_04020 [Clostridiales bacterium GWB2_37_7]